MMPLNKMINKMILFKKKEWSKDVTAFKLSMLLQRHYTAFNLQKRGWVANDIWYFLQLHHWLYPEPLAQYHHYNTIEKILVELME